MCNEWVKVENMRVGWTSASAVVVVSWSCNKQSRPNTHDIEEL